MACVLCRRRMVHRCRYMDKRRPPARRILSRATRRHQKRHGPVPRALRRLPRHGRPRRPRTRHHAGLGVGPDRRWPVQDHQERRARAPRCRPTRASTTTKRGRSSPTCARWPPRPRPIRRAATPRTARRSSGRTCASCHRVNGAGGRLGPDLSRIGVGALARDDRAAHPRRRRGDSRPGYEPVTLTPETGPPIQGVKKNEDLFSVQIMDTRERIQGYEKDKVKAVRERHAVGDAGVRPGPAERQRPRRSAPLSADAARLRSDRQRQ